jgi:hypothetical protein
VPRWPWKQRRGTPLNALADAHDAHARKAQARRITEARLGDAQRQLAIGIATTATLRVDITRVRNEATLSIDAARAEAHQLVQSETTARCASRTSLREATRDRGGG